MKRKNIFVAIAIAIILVLSISPIHGALINPYENWIETKDLKNCTISFSIDPVYLDSSFGELELLNEGETMRFENGKFDSANNTFRVSNTTKTSGKSYIDPEVDIKGILKKECQIVFDSGANNIKSFSAFVKSNYISSKGNSYQKEVETEVLIKGNGSHFPFSKRNWAYTSIIRLGLNSFKVLYIKDTVYWLDGPEEMLGYIKDIVKRKNTTCKGDYSKICSPSNQELIRFNFTNISHLKIEFDGYLPRLRDNEGICSYFGGPNDTGIDVALRKQFYEEYIGGTYDSSAFKRQEFSDMFNEWMNERKSSWERTGLECGYARELDTENDYFCAMRWHDNETERYNNDSKPGSKYWWREQKIKVTNTVNNISIIVAPVDWGPNVTTGRVIDLSHRAMEEINAATDVTWVEMCIVDSDTPLGLVTNQQDNKKIKKL